MSSQRSHAVISQVKNSSTPLSRDKSVGLGTHSPKAGNTVLQRFGQDESVGGDQVFDAEACCPSFINDAVNCGLTSPSQPLDANLREFMETSFGYDFSGVRVHTNGSAADSSAAIDANAYTVGEDIVFGAGKYSPANAEGKKLIAHELAHVVQSGNDGIASNRMAENNLTISEPSDASELEAEDAASEIVQNGLASQCPDAVYSTPMAAAAQNPSATVQRQGPDDVDPLGPTTYPPSDTELPGGGTLTDPVIPKAPAVPEIPEAPPGGFPELPPGGSMAPLAEGGAAEEGGALAGLGAEAALPLTAAGAAGAGLGYGMAKVADSSYTETGAFGTNPDTGQNQSAMDWGANWGTAVDKALGNTEPSVMGGIAAGAGGIVGGIGGAAYGAANWLADKL